MLKIGRNCLTDYGVQLDGISAVAVSMERNATISGLDFTGANLGEKACNRMFTTLESMFDFNLWCLGFSNACNVANPSSRAAPAALLVPTIIR